MKMTIRELYEWAIAYEMENAEIHIGYRDAGGSYSGYDVLTEQDISIDENGENIEI